MAYTANMDPLKIYDYLLECRRRLFAAARPLPADQHARQHSIGLKTIASTLTHLMTSEWYYIERLQNRTVPPYDQWPIHYENPPPLEIVERAWREQGERVRGIVAAERDWGRPISWLGFPDDTRGNRRFQICCTAGDLFAQLALHEMHHRAQAMAMLRESGSPVQDIDYNALMFARVEAL